MRFTSIICFLILFVSIGAVVQAQDKYGRPPLVEGIQELHIGDEVPDILIDKIINDDKRSIRTSDYKDRLLILDFWDTSCIICIASMPKLDSLQRAFGDRIKLLNVTWQDEGRITDFFKTNRFLNERTPPVHRVSVVEDRILRSYFRYQTNPHVIWIYKGKVVAITGGEYISAENIQAVLDGKEVNWPLKSESFDTKTPFMLLSGLSQDAINSPFYSYSVLTGLSNAVGIGIGGAHFSQDTVQDISRLALFNQNIYTAYQMLLHTTKPKATPESIAKGIAKLPYLPHPSRRALEVKDPSRYLYKSEYGNQADWNRANLICYEMVKHGKVDNATLAKLAVQDLNNRLSLNGRYEMRKVKCLVFVRTDKPVTDTLPKGTGGFSIPALVMMELDRHQKYPPAIDETGLGFDVELNLADYDGTIAGLRKEMQRHGLDLIEAEREIEVLVISDN